jgi:hypothetical protein
MKTHLAILATIGILNQAIAQRAPEIPQTGIKVSYLGSLIYPGFKLGIEKPYKVIQLEKKKKNGVKTVLKEKYWTLNLGFYHHASFHDNLYLLGEWQLRRQKLSGWFFEMAPGIGYSRTFLGGTTYKVSGNGNVTRKQLAGYHYALFSFSGGLGYDFSRKVHIPVKTFFKASSLLMTPSNSSVYVRPTAELGVIFSTQLFLKTRPLVKQRTK